MADFAPEMPSEYASVQVSPRPLVGRARDQIPHRWQLYQELSQKPGASL
jgi:hypothetical protein